MGNNRIFPPLPCARHQVLYGLRQLHHRDQEAPRLQRHTLLGISDLVRLGSIMRLVWRNTTMGDNRVFPRLPCYQVGPLHRPNQEHQRMQGHALLGISDFISPW